MSYRRPIGVLIAAAVALVCAPAAVASPPPSPAVVNAQQSFANTAAVTTAPSPDTVRWELYRSTSTLAPPSAATLVTTCAGTTGCNDYVAPVTAPGTYYYALVAINTAGERSAPSPWSAGITYSFDPASLPKPSMQFIYEGSPVKGTEDVTVRGGDPDGISTLMLYADGGIVGNTLSNVASGTIFWDTTMLLNGEHDLTLVARDKNGIAAAVTRRLTAGNPLSRSIVGAYGFDYDSGTTVVDDSGHAANGTTAGNPTWSTAGRNGRALSLDGVDDSVGMGWLGNFARLGFTIEAWVKPASAKKDVGIVGSWRSSDGGGPMLWIDHVEGHAQVTAGAGAATYLDSQRTLTTGAWQHVAATFDGSSLRYFIDGTEVASRTFLGTVPNPTLWQIGNYAESGGHQFHGLLDDVRIYKRPLTAAEIATDRDTPTRDLPAVPAAPQLAVDRAARKVRLSWNFVTGGTTYAIHRGFTAGFTPTAANRIGTTTSTSLYTDASVTVGSTYRYVVVASNTAGSGGPSNEVAATVTPDVTPPVVTLNTPINGATVSGIVRPLATATDEDGSVAWSNLYVDGAPTVWKNDIGTLSWDTRAIANGTHTLQVRSQDDSNNIGSSLIKTVTVDNHGDSSGAGLLAAYDLDEGSGAGAGDGSGYRRDGTLTGAGWSNDGKRGGAIDLRGGGDRVDLPSLGTFYRQGLTLEAWVKPSTDQRDAGIVGTWTSAGGGGPMLWVDHISGHYRMTAGTALADYVDFGVGPEPGTWHHLAATYDGAEVKAYLDGTLVAARAISPSSKMGAADTWRIGAYGANPDNAFRGLVDDVRIYGTPLAVTDIRADMNGAPVVSVDGFPPTAPTDLAAGTATISSVPLTWTAATDDKSVKDYLVYVDGTHVATVTDTAATVEDLACGREYTLGVAARDTANKLSERTTITASAAACPPRSGLVAAYSFDQGDAASEPDVTGNGHVAEFVGAGRAGGKHGQALSLTGTGRADLGSLGTFYKDGFTLEAWVKNSDIDGRDQGILGTWNNPEGGPMLWVAWSAWFYKLTLATGDANYLDTRTFPKTSWQHLAATYNGATARFYVDGVEVASKPFTGNVGDSDVWRIGAYGSTPGGYFKGLVDDVRIYSRGLSAGEVLNDMNEAVAPAW
jgi:hypothetical protein